MLLGSILCKLRKQYALGSILHRLGTQYAHRMSVLCREWILSRKRINKAWVLSFSLSKRQRRVMSRLISLRWAQACYWFGYAHAKF